MGCKLFSFLRIVDRFCSWCCFAAPILFYVNKTDQHGRNYEQISIPEHCETELLNY